MFGLKTSKCVMRFLLVGALFAVLNAGCASYTVNVQENRSAQRGKRRFPCRFYIEKGKINSMHTDAEKEMLIRQLLERHPDLFTDEKRDAAPLSFAVAFHNMKNPSFGEVFFQSLIGVTSIYSAGLIPIIGSNQYETTYWVAVSVDEVNHRGNLVFDLNIAMSMGPLGGIFKFHKIFLDHSNSDWHGDLDSLQDLQPMISDSSFLNLQSRRLQDALVDAVYSLDPREVRRVYRARYEESMKVLD